MAGILQTPIQWIRPIYEKSSFHRSVIEELDDKDLRECYAHCRSITKKYAKTFYMATRFLPNKKQRSIFAIYSLCRYVDDLVDEAEDLIREEKMTRSEIEVQLDSWKEKLRATYDGKRFDNPILLALSDVLRQYEIPIELPFELMEGVAMDLTKDRFQNFDELYEYSYKVASVVGLMTSEVFGYSDKKALPYAVDLGIAMQLTNILRDVGEDAQRGRIYLPQNEMRQFNITDQDILTGEMNEEMVRFLKFQIDRARSYYKRANLGIQMLERDSRLPVFLASNNYGRILDKIEENGYDVFSQRAYLNSIEKLSILPQVWFRMVS